MVLWSARLSTHPIVGPPGWTDGRCQGVSGVDAGGHFDTFPHNCQDVGGTWGLTSYKESTLTTPAADPDPSRDNVEVKVLKYYEAPKSNHV